MSHSFTGNSPLVGGHGKSDSWVKHVHMEQGVLLSVLVWILLCLQHGLGIVRRVVLVLGF